MKPLFLSTFLIFLVTSLGSAQVGIGAPDEIDTGHKITLASSGRGLGDLKGTMDLIPIIGNYNCLGVEFDGNSYWVTCPYDFTISYIYEISPAGVLVNRYPQPPANWGFWGWRGLAWDSGYLNAGDDSAAPACITQIDPADGTPTGTYYGPYPINLCRALAYQTCEDCFWTASFSTQLYKCFKNGTYQTVINPGITAYGAAMEESDPDHPMLWWITYEMGGATAVEFDPISGVFTGKSFSLVGGGGGACAYDSGGGAWELAVVSGTTVYFYDLATIPTDPLEADKEELNCWEGGEVTFSLDAGDEHAGRLFALFGSLSGSTPGTVLPGGEVLPINWDGFTGHLLRLAISGHPWVPFIGNLDGDGKAEAVLTVPPNSPFPGNLPATFAFCLAQPFDFVSNPVEVMLIGEIPDYIYDDGSSENLFGWIDGGDLCWIHYFEAAGGSDVVAQLCTAFGSPSFPGLGPGNGAPAHLYIWDDPNNDGNPIDAVFLAKIDVAVKNVDTDIINHFDLAAPVQVDSGFFVGASLEHGAGQYVAPADTDVNGYGGWSWTAGNTGPSAVFDYINIANNNHLYNMAAIGYPCNFLLRAYH